MKRLVVVYEFDDYARVNEQTLAAVQTALNEGACRQGMGFPPFTKRSVTIEECR